MYGNFGSLIFLTSQSVAPISGTSDEMMILKMMDEEDGVVNRRIKKVGKKKDNRLLLNGMAESQDDLDNPQNFCEFKKPNFYVDDQVKHHQSKMIINLY